MTETRYKNIKLVCLTIITGSVLYIAIQMPKVINVLKDINTILFNQG